MKRRIKNDFKRFKDGFCKYKIFSKKKQIKQFKSLLNLFYAQKESKIFKRIMAD